MHIPPDWGIFFTVIVSFLIFWFIFGRLFFRPYLNLFAEREKTLKDLSARAEELIKRAKASDEEREAKLAAVRSDALAHRDSERRRAEAEAARQVEAAKSDARAALEEASARIEREIAAAEQQLEQFGHRLGTELAERVLGRPLNRAPN